MVVGRTGIGAVAAFDDIEYPTRVFVELEIGCLAPCSYCFGGNCAWRYVERTVFVIQLQY